MMAIDIIILGVHFDQAPLDVSMLIRVHPSLHGVSGGISTELLRYHTTILSNELALINAVISCQITKYHFLPGQLGDAGMSGFK